MNSLLRHGLLPQDWPLQESFLWAFVLCAATTAVLVLLALPLGLTDRVGRNERERKSEANAARTPVIGGIALAISVGLIEAFSNTVPSPWALAGLALAFLLGLADDLRPGGIPAGIKLALQGVASVFLSVAVHPAFAWAGPWAPALAVLFSIGAFNVWNTWDHADGNAGGSGLLGFFVAAPAVAGACAAFLFFNLGPARRRPILGDAGSHLLAALCVLTPASWPILLLPTLDLARVCIERLLAGEAPWRGDRRHLAHRLQRRGLPRHAIFFALGCCSALSFAGPAGLALTSLGFVLLVIVGRGELGREERASLSETRSDYLRGGAARERLAPPLEPARSVAGLAVRSERLPVQ